MTVSEAAAHLCQRCQEISFEKIAQPGGFTHSEQLSQLLESANACVLCGLILRALNESGDIIDGELMTEEVFHKLYRVILRWRESQPEECSVEVCAIEASQHRLRSLVVSKLVTKYRRLAEPLDYEPSGLHAGHPSRGMDWKRPLTGLIAIYTDNCDLSATSDMRHCRRLPQTTKSAESIEVLSTWLNGCIHDHGSAEPLTSAASEAIESHSRPTRFVQIQSYDNSTGRIPVRLVHESSVGTKYATLSYVWGPRPHGWQTTRANIHSRSTEGFDISELPPTLKDAISLAARLSIDYVWIDCLCIIQDDAEEWARESVSMRSIYANALLNIAADGGSSPQHGLHNDRSTAEQGGVGAWLPVNEKSEQSHALYFHWTRSATNYHAIMAGPKFPADLPPFDGHDTDALDAYETSFDKCNWNNLIDSSPLSQRAWVFQERFLSKRTVHFTDAQMFWQCDHLRESEDKLPLSFPGFDAQGAALGDPPLFPDPSRLESMDSMEFAEVWYNQIVSPYSARDLTFTSDRLVAIAGIAELLQRLRPEGVRYLAGLWSDSILQGLTWTIDRSQLMDEKPHNKLRDRKRLRTNVAPSWSWASYDSTRSFRFDSYTVWCCKVISCDTKTVNDDPFGKVLSGTLVLEGHLLEVSLVDPREEVLYGGSDPDIEDIADEEVALTHARTALVLAGEATINVSCDIMLNGRSANKTIRGLLLCHDYDTADFMFLEKTSENEKDGDVWTKIGDGMALLSPEKIEAVKVMHFERRNITIV